MALWGHSRRGAKVRAFILEEFLPYQLAVLAERVSREFSDSYRKRFDLSIAQWRLIAHLSQADAPLSIREIHAQVNMDKSKVSRAASQLEARGLVRKQRSGTDRRLVALSLSPEGWRLMEELAPIAHDFEQRLLARLGPDAAAFRTTLRAMLSR